MRGLPSGSPGHWSPIPFDRILSNFYSDLSRLTQHICPSHAFKPSGKTTHILQHASKSWFFSSHHQTCLGYSKRLWKHFNTCQVCCSNQMHLGGSCVNTGGWPTGVPRTRLYQFLSSPSIVKVVIREANPGLVHFLTLCNRLKPTWAGITLMTLGY